MTNGKFPMTNQCQNTNDKSLDGSVVPLGLQISRLGVSSS